jgi:DNA repair protein RadA/Sms
MIPNKLPGQLCSFCSCSFPKRLSACPRCKTKSGSSTLDRGHTKLLSEADEKPLARISTGPWDRCFGPANGRERDGIVETSVALIGGLRGGGKSTLSLQLCDNIAAKSGREVLYICSEEDIPEVKLRAQRIKVKCQHLIRGLTTATGTESFGQLESILAQYRPCAIILDSIPGLMGPDMAGAVDLCKLMKTYSVKLKAPSILIDHVNKDGDFAGKEELQHTPDTCITLFPRPGQEAIRVLTTEKNRFGQAYVSVALEMTETGLRYVDEDEDDAEESPTHPTHPSEWE